MCADSLVKLVCGKFGVVCWKTGVVVGWVKTGVVVLAKTGVAVGWVKTDVVVAGWVEGVVVVVVGWVKTGVVDGGWVKSGDGVSGVQIGGNIVAISGKPKSLHTFEKILFTSCAFCGFPIAELN